MKYTFRNIFAGFMLFGAVSCTTNYMEINDDPYGPNDLGADDYGLGASMNALASCVVSSDVNTTQFTDCLLGGTQGGYFADAKADWKSTISNYNPTDDWTRVFLKSDKVIPILYTNLNAVKIASEATNNPVPYAIAQIIKVATMHRVADTYGPIPYSQIGADGKIATPYDSLEQVYDKFFEELNAAIEVLTERQNDALSKEIDYVYRGDVRKWAKFANSLKLRLAIRIAEVAPDKAREMAESAVANEMGLILSNDDNASWKYFGGATSNPINVAVNYNKVDVHEDGSKCMTSGDTHAAADIICYMNGYNDPRREFFFSKSEWENVEYCGLRRGIDIPDHVTVGHKYSGVAVDPAAPAMWLSAAEVAFLRAEGVAIYGFNMGGSAEQFYNDGIRLSFEQWGATNAAEYAANDELVPQVYTDPNGVNTFNEQLSTITVKWEEGVSKEEKQERIMIQKWIANWPLGNEAWADYRRTGFPHMIPVSANRSNGEVDSKRGARRMRYPLDEYISNTENVTNAVSNLLNGPDLMSTDLWWARKN